MKRNMEQGRPRTVGHHKTCLLEEWDEIKPETLHQLVCPVSKRLLIAVKKNGSITKWSSLYCSNFKNNVLQELKLEYMFI